jgi:hypothetical protein
MAGGLVLQFLLSSIIICSPTFAGNIIKLETLTSDDTDYFYEADMNLGDLNVEICNQHSFCCHIENLNSNSAYGENDFGLGQLDSFVDNDLQGCKNFSALSDDNKIQSFLLSHGGIDAWLGVWIRVFLDDGTYFQCNIPDWMDNNEFSLSCHVMK